MRSDTQMTSKPSVLFDGGCPICRREIAFYQRRRGAEALNWVDLTEQDGETVCGIDRREAMARFHVVMPDGTPRSGAAAFIEIWQRLPAFRPLAAVFGNQIGFSFLERAYAVFLRLRRWR